MICKFLNLKVQMSHLNKKYKSWKYNSSQPIPRSTIQRLKNMEPEHGLDPEPQEMPTSSNNAKTKYKQYLVDSSLSVPETSLKRWSNTRTEESSENNYEDDIEYEENDFANSKGDDDSGASKYEDNTDGSKEDTNDGENSNDEEPGDEDSSDQGDGKSDENNSEENGDSDENEDEYKDYSGDDDDEDNLTKAASLYENSTLSINDAVIKVLDLWIDNKLSKVYLKQHLKLLSEILPEGNLMPKSPYKFFQHIKQQVPEISIIHHFFCKNCVIYLSTNNNACSNCGETPILKFYELDFEQQIKQLFQLKNLAKKLKTIPEDKEYIQDITDGTEYKRATQNQAPYDITLILYTDGLSLVKSSKSHCWPLMFVIAELPPTIRHLYIVTFGLWCDNKIKPPMNLFLQPFCVKMRKCYDVGIEWIDPSSGVTNQTKICAPLFLADAPARAQLLNMLNFNGTYGCNICEIKTKRCETADGKRVIRVFPFQKDLPLRSQSNMKRQADSCEDGDKKGIKGHSIISLLPEIDISTSTVPEYMHSVLLGVVKQFLNVWINKKGPWKIKKYLNAIDNHLLNIKPPSSFARLPRSLADFHCFKATEFYNFLIFYSLPILNGILAKPYIEHWMLLVLSVYKLLKQRIHLKTDLQKAEQLLLEFVSGIEELYGERELTYNVHQLLHLSLVVKRWGPLWATSAFIFESQNGVLARNVHGHSNLGQELINNLQIIEATRMLKCISNVESKVASNESFSVLGKIKTMPILNEEEASIFLSKNIDVKNIKIYFRAQIEQAIFTSNSYKETKTNNYSVIVKENGLEYYGCIRFFFMKGDTLFFLLNNFSVNKKNCFINTKTKAVVEHILPVEQTKNYSIFQVNTIQFVKHVIKVGNFICLKPNFYNVVC